MIVKQFRYGADNLGYLVHGPSTAIAIDPGAVPEMLAYAGKHGLTLAVVSNTHSHYDHLTGNREMLKETGAEFVDCSRAAEKGSLDVDGETIEVFPTPGHMDDCITFKAGASLITGDTLFNGTVGNCFSGDLKGFFDSIRFLIGFPPETHIYAGHDYVADSLAFARSLEPHNSHIDAYLETYDPDHVVSTLSQEMRMNPFVRFNDPAMTRVLKERNMPAETAWERWKAMMEMF